MPTGLTGIPMFHKRLALLLAVTGAAAGVLALQVGRLTLVRGADLRAQAEARLVSRVWTPTVRGRILDRKGRVLAHDRPSYDIAVDFRVITGDWAADRAARTAKRLYARDWPALSAQERKPLVDRCRVLYDDHLERMWDRLAREAGQTRQDIEKRRAEVIAQVDRMYAAVKGRQHQREINAALARGQGLSSETWEEIRDRTSRPIEEQTLPHVLLRRIGDDVGFTIRGLAGRQIDIVFTTPDDSTTLTETVDLLPGVSVPDSSDRDYPYESLPVVVDRSTLPGPLKSADTVTITPVGIAAQVLGWMTRNFEQSDLERRAKDLDADADLRARALTPVGGQRADRGQYMPGDAAGQTGIEASQEPRLRGLRGLEITQLDTGERSALAADAGRDVRLSIDIMLQARVQAAMEPALGLALVQPWHGPDNPLMPVGTPLNGAAVVMEVESGEILAMVSTPSFSRQTLREHPEQVFEDKERLPYLNRAVARPYPPGSVAKALVLCGAVQHGKYALDSRIDCTGHLYPNRPDIFRCWYYKRGFGTHTGQLGHALDATEALMVSCNIFYFTLGQRLRPAGIAETYKEFGVTQPLNLGLGLEYAGAIGIRGDGSDLSDADATQMGIGQGPVAWTPVHAAAAYATLARRGVMIRPRILADAPRPAPVDLHLDPRAIDAALDGLSRVINDEQLGTGHGVRYSESGAREPIFNPPPNVHVWGKTGTATARSVTVDPDGEGPAAGETAYLDHSWFVILCGPAGGSTGTPKYAVAVMMEYGGSGGRVSGPIANQIIHALIAEGYL